MRACDPSEDEVNLLDYFFRHNQSEIGTAVEVDCVVVDDVFQCLVVRAERM